MSKQDSHLSERTGSEEHPPIRLQKLRALGKTDLGLADGKNPNGADKGPTEKKIGNAPCTY